MNKLIKKTALIAAALAVSAAAGLIVTGKRIGWGPFASLYDWDGETDLIRDRYDLSRQREIIFYGASNFRLWKEMEEDLKDYKVQNHGFGGSTDKLLIRYADKLLYPYDPAIIVFQTGSNDYVSLKGDENEVYEQCIAVKKEMFTQFHERLPEAKMIVLSGILMPGRDDYTPIVRRVNAFLREFCEESDYLYYVDSEEMTFIDDYIKEYFIKDGIHLAHEARLLWRDQYIRPMLEKVIEAYGLQEVRK
ncbi:MAG: hypothetical protein IJL85_07655 [Erysipelotrichaceae bacterium]|nr:hypothetical protein [Erysipelotrichaceae bacterium]